MLRHKIADLFPQRREEDYFSAVRNVSFTIEGEAVALISGNVAGKSTILGVVAGLVAPTSGIVKGKRARGGPT